MADATSAGIELLDVRHGQCGSDLRVRAFFRTGGEVRVVITKVSRFTDDVTESVRRSHAVGGSFPAKWDERTQRYITETDNKGWQWDENRCAYAPTEAK